MKTPLNRLPRPLRAGAPRARTTTKVTSTAATATRLEKTRRSIRETNLARATPGMTTTRRAHDEVRL